MACQRLYAAQSLREAMLSQSELCQHNVSGLSQYIPLLPIAEELRSQWPQIPGHHLCSQAVHKRPLFF